MRVALYRSQSFGWSWINCHRKAKRVLLKRSYRPLDCEWYVDITRFSLPILLQMYCKKRAMNAFLWAVSSQLASHISAPNRLLAQFRPPFLPPFSGVRFGRVFLIMFRYLLPGSCGCHFWLSTFPGRIWAQIVAKLHLGTGKASSYFDVTTFAFLRGFCTRPQL